MSPKRKKRYVFDTNVLISAALSPNGVARAALTKADRDGYFLLSEDTFAELKEVLYRRAFDPYVTNAERRRFIISFLKKARYITIDEAITACADPDDDMFLEVAINGKADGIVTRNVADFPADPFRGIPILTPEAFLLRRD